MHYLDFFFVLLSAQYHLLFLVQVNFFRRRIFRLIYSCFIFQILKYMFCRRYSDTLNLIYYCHWICWTTNLLQFFMQWVILLYHCQYYCIFLLTCFSDIWCTSLYFSSWRFLASNSIIFIMQFQIFLFIMYPKYKGKRFETSRSII